SRSGDCFLRNSLKCRPTTPCCSAARPFCSRPSRSLRACCPPAAPHWSIQFRRCAPNSTCMNDLRFAFRKLRESPAFTFIAIVTLALGIGLNTAIFSLINDLFLKGLPFQEPERVLHILTKGKDRTDEFQMSAPRFMLYRDGQTIFSGFAAENQEAATVTGLGDPL